VPRLVEEEDGHEDAQAEPCARRAELEEQEERQRSDEDQRPQTPPGGLAQPREDPLIVLLLEGAQP